MKIKLNKRFMSLILAGAMFVMAGCTSQREQELETTNQKLTTKISSLEERNQELEEQIQSLISEKATLEEEKAELEDEASDLKDEVSQLKTKVTELTQPEGLVDNNISRETAISLFYKDGKLNVDEISEPFQFQLNDIYEPSTSTTLATITMSKLADTKWYRELRIGDKCYLVDANDISKVYLCDTCVRKVDRIAYYYKYRDPNFGGTDTKNEYTGYVLVRTQKNGLITIYDFDSFEVLAADLDHDSFHLLIKFYFEQVYKKEGGCYFAEDEIIYYLEGYDPQYGGCDKKNKASGECTIFYKDGVKYLVDVNDFTKVLAYGFRDIDSYIDDSGTAIIEIIYEDGTKDIYFPDGFVPMESDVLTKKLG